MSQPGWAGIERRFPLACVPVAKGSCGAGLLGWKQLGFGPRGCGELTRPRSSRRGYLDDASLGSRRLRQRSGPAAFHAGFGPVRRCSGRTGRRAGVDGDGRRGAGKPAAEGLPAVRPGPGGSAARPAGHAVRPQHPGRRDQVRHCQAGR
uniref:Uncharacterized protein n=1 Tax=Parastrongyloides trichosuri TaxID=131310 RepID=A0A0N5A4S2_PARTI